VVFANPFEGFIEAEFARARALLGARRAQLERLAERLLVVETLERAELLKIAAEGAAGRPRTAPSDRALA
jgi:ATP-dependent Zn protease